jgi:hypothetical protein
MSPSAKIDTLIAGICDWRGKTFAAVKTKTKKAKPRA